MLEPMIAPSARERGFAISRLISPWPAIVGDLSEWCRPADIHFPRGSRNNGTWQLQIGSGRGPQAQALTQPIMVRVTASIGSRALDRVTRLKSLDPDTTINQTQQQTPRAGYKNH